MPRGVGPGANWREQGRRWWLALCALFCFFLPAALQDLPGPGPLASPAMSEENRQPLVASYGRLPLSFEANQGQTDGRVKYLSRGSGYILFLTSDQAVLSLRRSDSTGTDAVRLRLLGANPDPQVAGLDEYPVSIN